MLYLVSTLKSLYARPHAYSNFVSYESDGVSTVASFEIHTLAPFRDWLPEPQVGPVGNETATVIWVGVARQISLRTSNGPCLLPNSWSGAGFYAFGFTSRVRWVIIRWWWLS